MISLIPIHDENPTRRAAVVTYTLIAINFAVATTTVNVWVLVISAVCLVLAVPLGLLGWRFHQRKATAKAAFLWGLPIAPVLLTVSVLGVTYL